MHATPRVKICCICSLEEAWTAINHGASALGLVSEMPSGPGVIHESLIADIARRIPPFVSSVLLGIDIIRVIHVNGEGSIEEAEAVSPYVGGILLDSGSKEGSVVELGGTGRTHNWEISRRIVEIVDVPVILAGGLSPGNVAEAIKLVKPYAVDVCSSVRTGGSLDSDKLQFFMSRVRSPAQ
jgi:phosphoribosylanthranilate isomerase